MSLRPALTPRPPLPPPLSPSLGEGEEKNQGEGFPSPGEGDGVAGEGPGLRAGEGGVFRDRTSRWVKILSAYFTSQTLTQLLGIAAGLLFVNFMPVPEFAIYTLAFSFVSFFTFASDLGSTASLVYFYHQTAKEGGNFQDYLDAVLSLRRWAFLLGGAAVVLIFPWTAYAEGFDAVPTALVTAGILLCVWFQISASLRILALRLADRYGQSYRAEVAGGSVRLLLAASMVIFSLLWGWLGVLVSALGTAAAAQIARPQEAVRSGTDLRPYRRKVLHYLLPTLPSALYFSIQGMLTVWLAATFGGMRNIAEVGALGRLGLAVGLLSGLSGTVFLPRLARITDDRLYRRRYFQLGGLLLAAALAMVAVAALFPRLFLFLLGTHYEGLHRELLLVIASAGLTMLGGYAVAVNFARSWNRWQTVSVVLLIAAQAALVALLPLSTTSGVLLFNLLTAAVGLALQLAITVVGFLKPHLVHWS